MRKQFGSHIRWIPDYDIKAASVFGSEGFFDGNAMGVFHGKRVEVVVLAVGADVFYGVVEVFVGVDIGVAEFLGP